MTIMAGEGTEDKIKQEKRRGVILWVLLAVQILVIIVTLASFLKPGNDFYIMLLETPIENEKFFDPRDLKISRYDILDTVTFLTGSSSGMDEVDIEKQSQENRLRSKMEADEGQSMWVVLEDRVKDGDNLLLYAREGMTREDYANFSGKIKNDDVLNFVYDTGADEHKFRNNWKEVAARELKLSPILPWKKKLDFVAISNFDSHHWQGLGYILGHNPGILVICPPLTRSIQLDNPRAFELARNLVPIGEGYTRLTDRLGAFVTSQRIPGEKESHHELILTVKMEGGLAILAGTGMMGPQEIISKIKEASGEEVLYYLGGTNMYIGLETDEIYKELEKIKETAPDIKFYANYNISMIGGKMMKKVFGDKFQSAPLGYKVKFRKNAK